MLINLSPGFADVVNDLVAELSAGMPRQAAFHEVPPAFLRRSDLRSCFLPEADRRKVKCKLERSRFSAQDFEDYARYFRRARIFVRSTGFEGDVILVERPDAEIPVGAEHHCRPVGEDMRFTLVRLEADFFIPDMFRANAREETLAAVSRFEEAARQRALCIDCSKI